MSANFKMKARNKKFAFKTTNRARVSSDCNCKENHKSCGRKEDPAVDAMQDAGKVLSDVFGQLKDKDVAAMLVRAIRCRDARAVQELLNCDCRVVKFFCTQDKDCVRICCAFGRYNDVTVTFDICVRRIQDACHRNNFWF